MYSDKKTALVALCAAACSVVFQACPATGPKCGAGQTLCGSTCVDETADNNNCGACGNTCGAGAVCVNSCCAPGDAGHDVVAACYWTGQIVGVQSQTFYKTPLQAIGTNAGALAQMNGVVLVGDGNDPKIREARSSDLAPLPEELTIGGIPNQLLVSGTSLFVVNSATNSLDWFQTSSAPSDAGLGLSITNAINLGSNTNPYALTTDGTDLFVALYGGYGSDAGYLAGQKVARVTVGPSALHVARTYDLSAVNLYAFDGGQPVARPAYALFRDGGVYVALNNLNADYSVGGPGVVARIEPTTGAIRTINLGANRCLNAGSLAAVGSNLLVGCGGEVQYDQNYNALGVTATGVVMLDPLDNVVASWNTDCPSGSVDAGTCVPPSIGRLAVKGNRVVAADYSTGHVFALDVVGNQLVERRGYAAEADAGVITNAACAAQELGPVNICPKGGLYDEATVQDLVALP